MREEAGGRRQRQRQRRGETLVMQRGTTGDQHSLVSSCSVVCIM